MPLSDREMIKYFGNLEDHQYKHFNRSLGCQVEGKEHFKYLLDKNGFVPQEMGDKMAEARKDTRHKYDGLSKKAMEVCISAKDQATKKGKIKIGSRLQKGMEEVGVSFSYSDFLPSHYQPKGGFSK